MKIYPSNQKLPENLRWMIAGWAAAYYYNNRLYVSNTKGVALSCGCCLDIHDEDGGVHCDVETHIKDWLEQHLKQVAAHERVVYRNEEFPRHELTEREKELLRR